MVYLEPNIQPLLEKSSRAQLVPVIINKWRTQDSSFDQHFHTKIINTYKVAICQYARVISNHVIKEYVIVINWKSHASHHEHPPPDKDMHNTLSVDSQKQNVGWA